MFSTEGECNPERNNLKINEKRTTVKLFHDKCLPILKPKANCVYYYSVSSAEGQGERFLFWILFQAIDDAKSCLHIIVWLLPSNITSKEISNHTTKQPSIAGEVNFAKRTFMNPNIHIALWIFHFKNPAFQIPGVLKHLKNLKRRQVA